MKTTSNYYIAISLLESTNPALSKAQKKLCFPYKIHNYHESRVPIRYPLLSKPIL